MAFGLGQNVTPDNLQEAIQFYEYLREHPDALLGQGIPQFAYDRYMTVLGAQINALQNGDYLGLQSAYAQTGVSMSPEQEKAVDNQIALQNTQQAQAHEEYMRDTNILSSGQQYESLGLSPTILSGAITSSNGVEAANNAMTNLSQHRSLERYRQQFGMARQMISMAGNMASSGIYGASLNAARHAAASAAEATAHSGLQALQNLRPQVRNQLMKD